MINDYAYQAALTFTLDAEGGYSNVKDDHGGPTNFGITQVAYDQYTGGGHPVTEITRDIAELFYYKMVWLAGSCNQMPLVVGVCHFDWATNHGVHGADESLQKTLGVNVDGMIGPQTLAKINSQDALTFANSYLDYRKNWYQTDVDDNPSQELFLKGWLARVERLRAYIQGL